MIEHIVFFAVVLVVLFALLRHDKSVREEILFNVWVRGLKTKFDSAVLDRSITYATLTINQFSREMEVFSRRVSTSFTNRTMP